VKTLFDTKRDIIISIGTRRANIVDGNDCSARICVNQGSMKSLFGWIMLWVLTQSSVCTTGVSDVRSDEAPHFIGCNSSTQPIRVNLFDYDVVVVGAGLSGAVVAQHVAAVLKRKVLVLERRNHAAGNTYECVAHNCIPLSFLMLYVLLRYDFVNRFGIRISQYGPHLFHTKSTKAWSYVRQFADWEHYEHRVVGHVDR